jgi:CheY-like chemotaxis protein
MDERSDTSPHLPGPDAIPELDSFDTTTFDTLPSWASAVSDLPPLILIVDDELDIILILHRLLQDLAPDCDIITSTDPVEALERIRGRTVPLMITDVSLPVMSGVDLAAQIKERTPETQILLITGYPSQTLAQQALHRGIEYLLPKPFAFADLERIVEMALHQNEAPGQRPYRS